MNWEPGAPEADLRAWLRRLIALRTAAGNSSLIVDGTRRVLHLDAGQGTYAYARESETGVVIAAFNTSAAAQTLRLDLPAPTAALADRLNGHAVRVVGGRIEIDLPAGEGAWVA